MDLTFGSCLRHYRNKIGYSQRDLSAELAERMGMPEKSGNSLISKWENDVNKPTEEVVEDLESILGVPEGLLLNLAGYKGSAELKRIAAGGEIRQENEMLKAINKVRYEKHLARLSDLAKDLLDDIELSRFGKSRQKTKDTVSQKKGILSILATPVVYRSRGNRLWPYLMQHLDEEFRDPQLSVQINGITPALIMAASINSETRKALSSILEKLPSLEEIKRKLFIVSERGTFAGTCDICHGWFIEI